MKVIGVNVTKSYPDGKRKHEVFKDLNFEIDLSKGPAAILGPSGSGKSTLLSLIGGLDVPDAGEVLIDDVNVAGLKREQRAKFRLETCGYVFQDFNLLPNLKLWENVALPAVTLGKTFGETYDAAKRLLDLVGCGELAERFSGDISGGQMQRVAIARALINDPKLVLADEPTGNLDRATASKIFELLSDISQLGSGIILVTHDEELADRVPQRFLVADGGLKGSEH